MHQLVFISCINCDGIAEVFSSRQITVIHLTNNVTSTLNFCGKFYSLLFNGDDIQSSFDQTQSSLRATGIRFSLSVPYLENRVGVSRGINDHYTFVEKEDNIWSYPYIYDHDLFFFSAKIHEVIFCLYFR